MVSSLYFGLELFTRFLCCQHHIQFLFDFLNIIDLLDLLIFVAYAVTRFLAIQQYGPGRHFLISIMHKTRLLCVARLFKLCRHSRGLRILTTTIVQSKYVLLELLSMQVIFSIIFGAFMYHAESDIPNSPFQSIPISAYWALFTMNTMGYKEFVPLTSIGKGLRSFGAIPL